MRRRTTFAFAAALLLAACSDPQAAWTGWAYPDADNLEHYTVLTGFQTFEACQEATIGVLRTFEQPDAGTFICGEGCRWDATLGTNVCSVMKR